VSRLDLAAELRARAPRLPASATSRFWSAHQRFFRLLVTAAKLPTLFGARDRRDAPPRYSRDTAEIQQRYSRDTAEIQPRYSRDTPPRYSRDTAEIQQRYS